MEVVLICRANKFLVFKVLLCPVNLVVPQPSRSYLHPLETILLPADDNRPSFVLVLQSFAFMHSKLNYDLPSGYGVIMI